MLEHEALGRHDVSSLRSIPMGGAAIAPALRAKVRLVILDKEAAKPTIKEVKEQGRLPVVMFTAGGIATPADAALMMQLGSDGVFVGSGIFKSDDPTSRAKAIVEATTHFRDPEVIARVSTGLGDAMRGIETSSMAPEQLLESRGW